MAFNISTLLSKKKITGYDVGKALIESAVNDLREQDKENYKPLFSQAEFERLRDRLSSEKDLQIFSGYSALYNKLAELQATANTEKQYFYTAKIMFDEIIREHIEGEQLTAAKIELPFIMTEQEYTENFNRAKEARAAHKESFYSLLLKTAETFARDKGPQPIADIAEALSTEAAENQRVLKDYANRNGIGRLDFAPSGKRSYRTQVKHFRTAASKHTAAAQRLFYNGTAAVKEFYKANTGEPMPDTEAAAYMDALAALAVGKDDIEHRAAEVRLASFLSGVAAEWITDSSPDVSKLTILSDAYYFYYAAKSADTEQKHKEFKADYPRLYEALASFLKSTVPAMQTITAAQSLDNVVTWGELNKLHYPGFSDALLTPSDIEIVDSLREAERSDPTLQKYLFDPFVQLKYSYPYPPGTGKGGIAILKGTKRAAYDIRFAYMTGRPLGFFYNTITRRSTTDFAAFVKGEGSSKIGIKEGFYESLSYLYAYKELLRILSVMYKVPHLTRLLNMDDIEKSLESTNAKICKLFSIVIDSNISTLQKRDSIKKDFELFIPSDFVPESEDVYNTAAEFADPFSEETIGKMPFLISYTKRLAKKTPFSI